MKTLDMIFKTTLTVSHAMLIYALGSDWINTMISRHRRKKEEKLKKDLGDDEDEDYSWNYDEADSELYIPELNPDALWHLNPYFIDDFVREKMLPEATRTLSHMTMQERYTATLLLTSYIGFLIETAPDEERDFCVLLELLENSVASDDVESPSVTEKVIEDAKRFEEETNFYQTYRHFKTVCKDPAFIIHCCTEIVSVIVVKLYGYIPVKVSEKTANKGERDYVKFRISGM